MDISSDHLSVDISSDRLSGQLTASHLHQVRSNWWPASCAPYHRYHHHHSPQNVSHYRHHIPGPPPARAQLRRDQSHSSHFRFPPPAPASGQMQRFRDGARGGGETSVSTVSRYLASAPGTPTFLTLGHRSRLVRASFTPLYTSRSKLRITGVLFRLAEESQSGKFLPWRRLVLLKMSPRTLED